MVGAWSRLQQGNRVVIVAVQEMIDPMESCSRKIGAAWMLLDRGGAMARRYNAGWLPRAYALDEQGRVTYVQPETTLDPQAPLQVAALWGREGDPPAGLLPPAALPRPLPLSPAALLAGAPIPKEESR